MIELIALGYIDPAPRNIRQTMDEAALAELVESIRADGLLQNLVVRREGGRYVVVAGSRRYAALQRLAAEAAGGGWDQSVPCQVLPEGADWEVIQTLENLQRVEVAPLEEAAGMEWLATARGWDRGQLARRLGVSPRRVRERLALRGLPEAMAEALRAGDVPMRTALLIAGIPCEGDRESAAREILEPVMADGPLRYELAAEWVRERYMRDLGSAQWDPDDGALVPEAGPCWACPHLSGNREDALPGRGDQCTSPSCYRSKSLAHWERLRGTLSEEEVLSDAEARRALWGGSAVRGGSWVGLHERPTVGETGHYGERRPWEEIIAGGNVRVVHAWDGTVDRVVRVVRRVEALGCLDTAAPPDPTPSPGAPAKAAGGAGGGARALERQGRERMERLVTALLSEEGERREVLMVAAAGAWAASYDAAHLAAGIVGVGPTWEAMEGYLADSQDGEVWAWIIALLVSGEARRGPHAPLLELAEEALGLPA